MWVRSGGSWDGSRCGYPQCCESGGRLYQRLATRTRLRLGRDAPAPRRTGQRTGGGCSPRTACGLRTRRVPDRGVGRRGACWRRREVVRGGERGARRGREGRGRHTTWKTERKGQRGTRAGFKTGRKAQSASCSSSTDWSGRDGTGRESVQRAAGGCESCGCRFSPNDFTHVPRPSPPPPLPACPSPSPRLPSRPPAASACQSARPPSARRRREEVAVDVVAGVTASTTSRSSALFRTLSSRTAVCAPLNPRPSRLLRSRCSRLACPHQWRRSLLPYPN